MYWFVWSAFKLDKTSPIWFIRSKPDWKVNCFVKKIVYQIWPRTFRPSRNWMSLLVFELDTLWKWRLRVFTLMLVTKKVVKTESRRVEGGQQKRSEKVIWVADGVANAMCDVCMECIFIISHLYVVRHVLYRV